MVTTRALYVCIEQMCVCVFVCTHTHTDVRERTLTRIWTCTQRHTCISSLICLSSSCQPLAHGSGANEGNGWVGDWPPLRLLSLSTARVVFSLRTCLLCMLQASVHRPRPCCTDVFLLQSCRASCSSSWCYLFCGLVWRRSSIERETWGSPLAFPVESYW